MLRQNRRLRYSATRCSGERMRPASMMAMAWPRRRFMCCTRNWLNARLVSRSVWNSGRGRHSKDVGRSATTSYLRASALSAEPSPNHSPSGIPMKAEVRALHAGLRSVTSPWSTACQPSTCEPTGSMTSPLAPSVWYTPLRTASCSVAGRLGYQGWLQMKRSAGWATQNMQPFSQFCGGAIGKTLGSCLRGDRCWQRRERARHCAPLGLARPGCDSGRPM